MIYFLCGLFVGYLLLTIVREITSEQYRRGFEDGYFQAIKQETINNAICQHLDE